DRAGSILFIVGSRGTLSLHQLASFLVESDLSIDTALNLDGGGSTGLWLADEDEIVNIDSFTSVPSVIAVSRQ
ncbi:MAG: phosphodiester glycosidase family protein, partial [Chloroflexota bacterium]